MAKTRVAPLKPKTIPVLELFGGVLLTQLLLHVLESISVPIARTVCWTDSQVVLAWLRKHPLSLKSELAYRVSKIHEGLPEALWKHVRTHDNPADLNSRGVLARDLIASTLWWQGPAWLSRDESEWPKQKPPPDTKEGIRETNVHLTEVEAPWTFLHRYSTWTRLLRVTAYVVKFYKNARKFQNASREPGLDAAALHDAALRIARYLQRLAFRSELAALQRGQELPTRSQLLRLDPFLDDEGVLRVGGRLRNAPLHWETKHPIILPKHAVSMLILRQCHLNTLHGGAQLTMRMVRERFWILQARSSLRTILDRCVRCTRERARTTVQKMQHLLPARCRPTRPFATVGVDYAGPYLVRTQAGRGRTSHKAYIAVFVCYATRAIHIELVHDYSTPTFLAALDRFVARRGLPTTIHSDNGTNFVGADRELRSSYEKVCKSQELRDRCANLSIAWKFNPPSAPHFGGMQEAGVKVIKYHLHRILGTFRPTAEEMHTLLCNIEATLNSRPIAPLSEDPTDLDALTPGHFLVGAPLKSPPVPTVEDIPMNRLSRWQVIQRFHEHLWRKWRREYLTLLQSRYKWKTSHAELKVNDLVLIENTQLPPREWEMGRVVEVHPDGDGHVREVLVRTARATIRRAITRMVKLETEESESKVESTATPLPPAS